MTVIDNYIREVQANLSGENQDDVLDELRSLIDEQVAELREASEGDLTDENIASILRRLGNPVTVARAYSPQRYLIGPSIFPSYLLALKKSLLIGFAIYVAVLVILGWANDSSAVGFLVSLLNFVSIGLWLFAGVTLLFVLLEYSEKQWLSNRSWDPIKDLKQPKVSIDTSDIISNLVTDGFILLLLNGFSGFNSESSNFAKVVDLSSLNIQLTNDWQWLFWFINLVLLVSFSLHLWVLMVGYWRRSTLVIKLLLVLPSLAIICALLSFESRVLVSSVSAVLSESAENLVIWLDRGFFWTIVVIGLVVLYDAYKDWRCYRRNF